MTGESLEGQYPYESDAGPVMALVTDENEYLRLFEESGGNLGSINLDDPDLQRRLESAGPSGTLGDPKPGSTSDPVLAAIERVIRSFN